MINHCQDTVKIIIKLLHIINNPLLTIPNIDIVSTHTNNKYRNQLIV